jgi:hypothetical protein
MSIHEHTPGSPFLAWARIALVSVTLLLAPGVRAQPAVAEPNLKAAIVFTLAKFAEWPPAQQQGDSLALCVVAAGEPLRAAFSALDSKLVQGKTLRVRLYGPRDDLAGCHIVFTSGQPPPAVPGRLTVGDSHRFAESGGMVGLVTSNERIQLEMNLGIATGAAMKFSSQLLRLAKLVGETSPKGGG